MDIEAELLRIFPALNPEDLIYYQGIIADGEALEAFKKLQLAAIEAGFSLDIASSFRSFARQEAIVEAKFTGHRPVLDERERPIDITALNPDERIVRICYFSALPGLSRHHLGTEFDVYSQSMLPKGQTLQLTAAEYAPDAYFAPLGAFLAANLERFGFYRPFAGGQGMGCEPWHISYKVKSQRLVQSFSLKAWQEALSSRPGAYAKAALKFGTARYAALLALKSSKNSKLRCG